MKSTRVVCGIVAAVVLAVGWVSWLERAKASAPAARGTAGGGAATTQMRQKSVQMRGFSMRLMQNTPEGIKLYMDAVDEMADMGCSWINMSVAAYQDNVRSESIAQWRNALPKEADMLRIMAHAKSRGMGIMLMPVVLLNNSGPKDWRGVINPPSWDNWFASYTMYITDMAKMAKAGDVDIFCVGSELLSTEPDRERWMQVIAQIKANYSGKLTYSANWDHYTVVSFWDQLDYVGMNNYNELANKPGVPVSDLVKAWQPIKDKVLTFSAKQKKPFMFTEVGWHNLVNTIAEPWNYVAEGPIDHNEQLHAYQSFVETWKDVPKEQFMGAFVWEWEPGLKIVNGNFSRGSYSLQGTPAMEVVKKWFAMP